MAVKFNHSFFIDDILISFYDFYLKNTFSLLHLDLI